ncbi:MAG: hypothetical protein ACR65R_06325 [Methylomicrobium sp.]
MSYIFDKGNPVPQRTLSFDIPASDSGKRTGSHYPKAQDRRLTLGKAIGKLAFNNAGGSFNGDLAIPFRHPLGRKDRNDPDSVLRKDRKRGNVSRHFIEHKTSALLIGKLNLSYLFISPLT